MCVCVCMYACTYACVCMYVCMHVCMDVCVRDRPIMLIILPIMLYCSAHKIYLLCSKLCSRIELCLVYYHYLYRNLHE